MSDIESVRERILAASLTCFDERGVTGGALRDIADRASSSIGAIYHHFEGKEQLAATLWVEIMRDYQDGFIAVVEEHVDAESGVRAAVAFHLEWCETNSVQARFLFDHRPSQGQAAELLKDANREFLGAVLRWWRPHVHYGRVADLDLALLQALWLGPSMELCRHWLHDRTPHRPRESTQTLADTAWAAVRSDDDRS